MTGNPRPLATQLQALETELGEIWLALAERDREFAASDLGTRFDSALDGLGLVAHYQRRALRSVG